MCSDSKLLLLLLTLATACVQSSALYNDEKQEYGIGFQFTPAYGTVAVAYANGSNIALGRVDGDRAWHDLMYKLCVDTRYMDFDVRDESFDADRVILVEMLQSLAEVGAARLGKPIQAAAVSLPAHHRVHHLGEFAVEPILRNAFNLAQLEYLPILDRDAAMGEPLIFAENSVIAGHGLGLCQPYTANRMCENGTRAPYDTFFLIGYYENELEVTRTSTQWSAYTTWWYGYPSKQSLGRNAKHNNGNEEFYWDAVRSQLRKVFLPGHIAHNLTKLIYYGDFASDRRLRLEVSQVLKEFGQMPALVDDGIDPVFSGALGVAEFAKRRPYFVDAKATPSMVDQSKTDL